jgi:hypothetical protein
VCYLTVTRKLDIRVLHEYYRNVKRVLLKSGAGVLQDYASLTGMSQECYRNRAGRRRGRLVCER